MDYTTSSAERPSSKNRLSTVSRDFELKPWRRAVRSDKCFLYWLAASAFPMRPEEKTWLNTFLSRLIERLHDGRKLIANLYLRPHMLDPAALRTLVAAAQQLQPVLGVARSRNGRIKQEDGERKASSIEIGSGVFAEACYLLKDRADEKQRGDFVGLGGTIFMFRQQFSSALSSPALPTGLKTHPLFQSLFNAFDVDKIISNANSHMDDSLQLSKKVFAPDLSSDPLFRKIVFVSPLLNSVDLLNQSQEEVDQLFGFCDLYIAESPADCGILMASKINFEEEIVEVLTDMLKTASMRKTHG